MIGALWENATTPSAPNVCPPKTKVGGRIVPSMIKVFDPTRAPMLTALARKSVDAFVSVADAPSVTDMAPVPSIPAHRCPG